MILPAGILGAVSTVSGVVGTIGGIVGGGDSSADVARKAEADRLFQAALNGDAYSERRLRCLSGDKAYNAEFAGSATAQPGCGYATTNARSYAKGLVIQLDARRTIGSTAGTVAAGATQVGLNTSASAFGSTFAGLAIPAVLSNPLVLIAILAILAFLLLR
jgi:hypothetical protein